MIATAARLILLVHSMEDWIAKASKLEDVFLQSRKPSSLLKSDPHLPISFSIVSTLTITAQIPRWVGFEEQERAQKGAGREEGKACSIREAVNAGARGIE